MDYEKIINEDHFQLDNIETVVLESLRDDYNYSIHPSVWSEEDIKLFKDIIEIVIDKVEL